MFGGGITAVVLFYRLSLYSHPILATKMKKTCTWFVFGVNLHQNVNYGTTKYIVHQTKR